MIKAVRAIVHENSTVKEAYDQYRSMLPMTKEIRNK
jgi:3-hydroxy-5-phosphonooxypentane-2,4-dione thiolase